MLALSGIFKFSAKSITPFADGIFSLNLYSTKNPLTKGQKGCIIVWSTVSRSEKTKEVSVLAEKSTGHKIIAQNKKAYHDYFVDEKYEAGIELFGTEVKSLRAGQVNLKDSYIDVKDGELFVVGMHVSPYEHGNIFNRDPLRKRKLLMHKREIMKLHGLVSQKGVSLIPLSLYFSGSRVKVEVGLCRGKKLYDKRDSIAKHDADREIERRMKDRM